MAKRKSLVARILVWLVVLAAIAAPVAYLTTREPAIDVTAAPVERGRVEQTISAIASGTVMAENDAVIAAEIMGKVVAVPVEEGAHVKAGDLLIELGHGELDAQVALAEANLQAGQAMGNQAVIGANVYQDVSATQVSQARAQMEQAQADRRRIESLFEQHAVSRSELDKVILAARVAEETYAAAIANQKQNQARQEEVRSSQANVEQLRAAIEAAKALRDKAFIKAPFDGVISERLIDPGEAVTPGVPLIQLVQEGARYVEAPFDEADAANIRTGQRVRLNIDAYRGVDFPGTVYYISPMVSLNRDFSRTLNVKVRVDEGQEKFVPGMSADVIILEDAKEDVLFVPSESLVREEYVYVIENGRAQRRNVKLGIGNWERTEIVEGLIEGDTLITSVSIKELQPGVKVNVVDELEE